MMHIKTLTYFIVITLLLVASSALSAKSNSPTKVTFKAVAQLDANGVRTPINHDEKAPTLALWVSSNTLGLEMANRPVIGLWKNWKSRAKLFMQLYPETRYGVEFERADSGRFFALLEVIKPIAMEPKVEREMVLGSIVWQQVSKDSSKDVNDIMQSWKSFTVVDYADVGDNESDAVLGKLINQGFSVAYPKQKAAKHEHHGEHDH